MKKVLLGALLCLALCGLDYLDLCTIETAEITDIWEPLQIPKRETAKPCKVIEEKPAEPSKPVREFSYEDAQILLRIGTAEAEGEGVEGIYKVLNVVINRVNSPKYPDSIKAVVFYPNAFSSVQNGRYERCKVTKQAHEALALLEGGEPLDKSIIGFEITGNKALEKYFDYAYTFGNHDFYMEKGGNR